MYRNKVQGCGTHIPGTPPDRNRLKDHTDMGRPSFWNSFWEACLGHSWNICSSVVPSAISQVIVRVDSEKSPALARRIWTDCQGWLVRIFGFIQCRRRKRGGGWNSLPPQEHFLHWKAFPMKDFSTQFVSMRECLAGVNEKEIDVSVSRQAQSFNNCKSDPCPPYLPNVFHLNLITLTTWSSGDHFLKYFFKLLP